MAKHYRKNDSGLLLPDTRIERPWHSRGPDSRQWMSRRKCCCGCTYFTDTFDRADSGDIGANWTEEAGAWSIASSKLTTSSSDAIALCTVRAAGAWFNYVIAVEFSWPATIDQHVKIYFSGTNAVDIWRHVVDDVTITTITVGGTTREQVGTVSSFKMCVFSDHIHFDTGTWTFEAAIASTTTEAGVGTGTISEAITVSSFSLSSYVADDPVCGCRDVLCSDENLAAGDQYIQLTATHSFLTFPGLADPILLAWYDVGVVGLVFTSMWSPKEPPTEICYDGTCALNPIEEQFLLGFWCDAGQWYAVGRAYPYKFSHVDFVNCPENDLYGWWQTHDCDPLADHWWDEIDAITLDDNGKLQGSGSLTLLFCYTWEDYPDCVSGDITVTYEFNP